ncbi:MAG: hypothetical protein KDA65_15575, partial [Planctomycetaceae bacterium]|nr:hypothetical protein [Planctomycetaceae bacterium]
QFKIPDFQNGEDFFCLFGLPFVLIGFAMLSSPLWSARAARRTIYVLTTERAITFEGGYSTTITSYKPEQLQELQRVQHADGSGDLIFEKIATRDSDGDRHTTERGFFGIPDVKAVEDRVRSLAEEYERFEA